LATRVNAAAQFHQTGHSCITQHFHVPDGCRVDSADVRFVYLGDFIDRGPDNKEVLRIVGGMLDAGTAQAIMGNHELNAIQFHTLHPETGKPLRKRTKKNEGQHKTFLYEFPEGETHRKG
jgi:hypothetical protein